LHKKTQDKFEVKDFIIEFVFVNPLFCLKKGLGRTKY